MCCLPLRYHSDAPHHQCFPMRASGPALCPACYARFVGRPALTAHLTARCDPARNDLTTDISLAPHEVRPWDVHRCPPCAPSVRQAMGSFCAPAHAYLLTPFRLTQPRVWKGCGFRRGRSAFSCHRLIAASQLSWNMRAGHLDMLSDNNVALRKAPGCRGAGTVRARCHTPLTWCAASERGIQRPEEQE